MADDIQPFRSVLGWIIVQSNACKPNTYSTWRAVMG